MLRFLETAEAVSVSKLVMPVGLEAEQDDPGHR